MTTLADLRRRYHQNIGTQIVRLTKKAGGVYPNFADGSSRSSVAISNRIATELGFGNSARKQISGQTAGSLFEELTCKFIEEAFSAIAHLRPGHWSYSTSETRISGFAQYAHLETLDTLVNDNQALAAALGHGYIITPDIVVSRSSTTRDAINSHQVVLDSADMATLTPFVEGNRLSEAPFLHTNISCKWTIRSNRSQNTRTEALNLIRNRKGKLPHIVAVTAEPLLMRIASLALGTGDLDCVYHFALDELKRACDTIPGVEDQAEMLKTMIQGSRLRDISDLPFDLAS